MSNDVNVACYAPDPNLTVQQNFAVLMFKQLLLQAPKLTASNRRIRVTTPNGTAELEVLTNNGKEGSYIFDVTVTEEKGARKKPN